MNRFNRERLTFLGLSLAVLVILSCTLVVYPFQELIHMSFLEWDGVSSIRSLAEFDNYIQLFFKSPEFWQAFRSSLTCPPIHGIMMPVELVLTVMFSSRFKGSDFVKAAIFLPFTINSVDISYFFSYFFLPMEGGFNYILTKLGMEGLIHNWLLDPEIVNYVLASVSVWRYMGFRIVLFMVGLPSVPRDMMEAAVVDGVNAWQRLRYVQFSAICTVIGFILPDATDGSLQMFDIPYIMTVGGPNGVSNMSSIYAVDTVFKYSNFGMASSMAVIMVFMIVCVQIAQRFIANRLRGRDQHSV